MPRALMHVEAATAQQQLYRDTEILVCKATHTPYTYTYQARVASSGTDN